MCMCMCENAYVCVNSAIQKVVRVRQNCWDWKDVERTVRRRGRDDGTEIGQKPDGGEAAQRRNGAAGWK